MLLAGLDWSDGNPGAAVWDAAAGEARMVAPPDAPRSLAVGFSEVREDGRRLLQPTFPLPDDWQEDRSSLAFRHLKRSLTSFRNTEVAAFLARPVFQYWVRALGAPAHLSFSVPLDYPWDLCEVLCSAALEAGLQGASFISETLAPVLAFLPCWRNDRTRWALLEGGRSVWVIDCGLTDLNLALVYVARSENRLDFALLAGDCLEDLGSLAGAVEPTRVAAEVQKSFPNVCRAAFEKAWPNWSGPAPQLRRADWIIAAGEGENLAPALENLRALIGQPYVCDDVPAAEATARGAAVHAANQAGALPFRIGTVRRRPVLGVRARLPNNVHFIAITEPDDEPPFAFERALEVEPTGGQPVEITLAAALPGGDRFGAVCSFVLEPRELAGSGRRALLVQGRLQDWSRGQAELRDLSSDARLAAMPFRLS
jgi:hypothetical protein